MANYEYISKIDTVKNATDAALKRAAEIIGGMMESNAKKEITSVVYETPEGWYIRTGNLRNSITHTMEEMEDGSIIIAVGSNVEYAPYVELGTGIYAEDGNGRKTPWRYQDHKGNWHKTRGMPPRPYLRPAVMNYIDKYKEVLKAELSKK